MKFSTFFVIILSFLQLIHDAISVPVPIGVAEDQQPDFPDYDIEDRRRKHKRKRRPCTRNPNGDSRWFLGHDLTLFLGDVTICGGLPQNTHGGTQANSGLYEGQVPIISRPTHRPHRPHRPHKPHRPQNSVKPVQEQLDEDYVQDNYYKPGPLVGVPSNQVEGQEQNLSNFSPTRIFSMFSRHFNSIVNPFIDLFYR